MVVPFDDQNHSFLHHSNPFNSPSFLYHFPALSPFSPWPLNCSIAGLPTQNLWKVQINYLFRLRRGFTTSQTLVNQRMSGTVRILFWSKFIHMYTYILCIYIHIYIYMYIICMHIPCQVLPYTLVNLNALSQFAKRQDIPAIHHKIRQDVTKIHAQAEMLIATMATPDQRHQTY